MSVGIDVNMEDFNIDKKIEYIKRFIENIQIDNSIMFMKIKKNEIKIDELNDLLDKLEDEKEEKEEREVNE